MLLSLLLLLLPHNEPDTIIWESIRVHEYLELQLPSNMERTDTLGQTVYTGESVYAIVSLSIVPEQANPKNVHYRLKDITELEEFYQGVETGSANSTGGKVSASNHLEIDSLDSRDFTIKLPNNESKRFVVTVVKDQLFMLLFWYHEDFEMEVALEIDRIIESMDFSPSANEQLNPKLSEDSQAYKIGQLFGQITVYLLIPGVIFLVYYLTRRKKKTGV
jgi:hypothetical protein